MNYMSRYLSEIESVGLRKA